MGARTGDSAASPGPKRLTWSDARDVDAISADWSAGPCYTFESKK